MQGPGPHDIIAFERSEAIAGTPVASRTLDFDYETPDIEIAVAEVERAGGRVLRRGEFGPGLPFVYVADPDGYEIEIWFE